MAAKLTDLEHKALRVEMPDGSRWDVPVMAIARNRAANYADEHDGDVERSLQEDTLPLFQDEPYEIEDWAANDMDWRDVMSVARMVKAPSADYQEGWVNGEKEIVEIVEADPHA